MIMKMIKTNDQPSIYLVDYHTLVGPSDDEKCVQGNAELLVVDLWYILDIDPDRDSGHFFVRQIELGIICWDANSVALGADLAVSGLCNFCWNEIAIKVLGHFLLIFILLFLYFHCKKSVVDAAFTVVACEINIS